MDIYYAFLNGTYSKLTHDEYMNFDETTMESKHDYIQIVFPLSEHSMYIFDSPVITIEEFK